MNFNLRFDESKHLFILSRKGSFKRKGYVVLSKATLFQELGCSIKDPVLVEWQNSFILSVLHSAYYGDNVYAIVTDISDKYKKKFEEFLKFSFAYNEEFLKVCNSVRNYRDLNCIICENNNREKRVFKNSKITLSILYSLLKDNYEIIIDRLDRDIVRLLGREFSDAYLKFNCKNYFVKFLQNLEINLPLPPTILIDSISLSFLRKLISLPLQEQIPYFIFSLLNNNIDYKYKGNLSNFRLEKSFLKISTSAGGHTNEISICCLDVNDHRERKNFEELIKLMIKRHKKNKPASLQIQEAIEAYVDNDQYKYPCFTIRISEDGKVFKGQVADQLFFKKYTYGGSYWSKEKEKQFLNRFRDEFFLVGQKIFEKSGYFGYFASDFILAKDSKYYLLADANARINGNDLLFFTRKILERKDVQIDSMYMRPFSIKNISDLDKFKYKNTNTGLIIFPILKSAVFQKGNNGLWMGIYINPEQDNRFQKFLKIIEKN